MWNILLRTSARAQRHVCMRSISAVGLNVSSLVSNVQMSECFNRAASVVVLAYDKEGDELRIQQGASIFWSHFSPFFPLC
jgi:hypothetical protein